MKTVSPGNTGWKEVQKQRGDFIKGVVDEGVSKGEDWPEERAQRKGENYFWEGDAGGEDPDVEEDENLNGIAEIKPVSK